MAVETLNMPEWEDDNEPLPEEAELDALDAAQDGADADPALNGAGLNDALPDGPEGPEADAKSEGDEDDEGEGDEGEQDEGETHDIMIDGAPAKVTTREALNGYIREKTFHQRMNQVDQAKQTVAAHARRVQQDRVAYSRKLEDADRLLASVMPAEPDWDRLYETDPQQARHIQTEYEKMQRTRHQIAQERHAIEQQAAQEQAVFAQEFARTEFPKFASTTGWRTEADMESGMNAMRETAARAGFTEQEIASIMDSRELAILHKAALYDQMMARRPAKGRRGGAAGQAGQAGQPQARQTGAARRSRATAPKGLKAAKERLARTGTVDDAGRAFQSILDSS